MGYLAPPYNEVIAAFEPGYTAPAYNAVNFDIEPPGGSDIHIPISLQLSTVVSSFSDFKQEIEAGFFLDLEIAGRSGPTIEPVITFAFSTVVDSFQESEQLVDLGLGFYSDITIGIKSFSDPVVVFALSTEVEMKSGKALDINTEFALATSVEISEIGEPLIVRADFALSTRVVMGTERNEVFANFALNCIAEQSNNTPSSIVAGFALSTSVESFKSMGYSAIGVQFQLDTAVTVKTDRECALPVHDSSRWT